MFKSCPGKPLTYTDKTRFKAFWDFFQKNACDLGFAAYVFHGSLSSEGDLATKLHKLYVRKYLCLRPTTKCMTLGPIF